MTTTELVAIIVKETSDGNEILNDDVAEVGKGKDEGCVDRDHFHTVKRTIRNHGRHPSWLTLSDQS